MDLTTLPEGLLDEVKAYLNITWNDSATDNRIGGIIVSGIVYLDEIAGMEQDYTMAGIPKVLLFDFCRYVRDGALDVFENNYLSLLNSMRNKRKVASRNAQTTF